MTTTKRYIVGHRFGPQIDPQSAKSLDTFVAKNESARSVRKTQVGRRVVEMTEAQMRDFQRSNPSLVIEEDQPLQLFAMPGLPGRVPIEGPFSLPVSVADAANGAPLSNVTIYGLGTEVTYKAVTDGKGKATLETREQRLRNIVASPRDGYWSLVSPEIQIAAKTTLSLTLKPLWTTGAYDWGHRLMGFHQVHRSWSGKEIRIGVVDSGISSTSGDITLAGGYNALDGASPEAWNVDEKGHGTHVAGIVAVHNETHHLQGAAPNAKVFSIKVFEGGYLSDLIEGIEWCICNRMDVINLSLGVGSPSQVLASVLRDAYDRGITCVAAVGNNHTAVSYPASLPTVISVGAIGRINSFPEDSAHALKISQLFDQRGGLFAANFSNFGPEVQFCAPGVAILSTVPTGYASWDGTSMSCPLITGLCALILEAYPNSRTGNPQQPEFVRSLLARSAFNLGMPPQVQGMGVPLAPVALGAAQPYPQRFYSYAAPGSPAAAPGPC